MTASFCFYFQPQLDPAANSSCRSKEGFTPLQEKCAPRMMGFLEIAWAADRLCSGVGKHWPDAGRAKAISDSRQDL